jgi:glutamine synthetase
MPNFIEYLWVDGASPTQTLRSKGRVLYNLGEDFRREDVPDWGFDGSSTGQATGDRSDCLLRPVALFEDPTRNGGHLALCEVFTADGKPHPTNHRARLRKTLLERPEAQRCWFGMEQEYTLFRGSRPLGFGEDRRFPAPQGPYYCGVGADEVFGRDLVEEHLRACVSAGVQVSGINAEVMPGQWEFQVGPLSPLEVGDHLWVARWLLYRLGERYGIHATLDPKPVPGDWNGAGMHTNFSTKEMREEDGYAAIQAWCEKARHRVAEHLSEYGDGIEMRLTGRHETCRFDQYKWGVSDRTASIRIPLMAKVEGRGYLEDRRPNANACPYRVANAILKTEYDLW